MCGNQMFRIKSAFLFGHRLAIVMPSSQKKINSIYEKKNREEDVLIVTSRQWTFTHADEREFSCRIETRTISLSLLVDEAFRHRQRDNWT